MLKVYSLIETEGKRFRKSHSYITCSITGAIPNYLARLYLKTEYAQLYVNLLLGPE